MSKEFRCPECGHLVEVVPDNIITPLSTKRIKVLLCPNLAGGPGQHIVRIRYHGKWEEPMKFLISGKEGIHEVIPGTRDEVAHYIMRAELFKEGAPFVDGGYLSPVTRVKIHWVGGVAVGYYSEFTHLRYPTLGELFVRPEYRGRGYGLRMLQDFLDSHPGGPVAFHDIYEKCMKNLLMKAGVVEKQESRYIFHRKIALLFWQANPIPFWER